MFWDFFSGSSMPVKKSYHIGKCMKTIRMFTAMEKKDLILKTPLAIFNMQMHRRKVFFSENIPEFTSFSLDLGLFSSGLKFL